MFSFNLRCFAMTGPGIGYGKGQGYQGYWPLISLFCISLISLVTGCTAFNTGGAGNQEAPTAYYHWLTNASDEELAEARNVLESESSAGNATATVIDRIRLALLLSVPEQTDRMDLLTAQEILGSGVLENESRAFSQREAAYQQFGRLWLTYLQDKERYRQSTRQNQTNELKILELSEKIAELQQQINDLTTIEQRLIEREQEQIKP